LPSYRKLPKPKQLNEALANQVIFLSIISHSMPFSPPQDHLKIVTQAVFMSLYHKEKLLKNIILLCAIWLGL
jgi:hypothetical protein